MGNFEGYPEFEELSEAELPEEDKNLPSLPTIVSFGGWRPLTEQERKTRQIVTGVMSLVKEVEEVYGFDEGENTLSYPVSEN
jgi:hypothetical protein